MDNEARLTVSKVWDTNTYLEAAMQLTSGREPRNGDILRRSDGRHWRIDSAGFVNTAAHMHGHRLYSLDSLGGAQLQVGDVLYCLGAGDSDGAPHIVEHGG